MGKIKRAGDLANVPILSVYDKIKQLEKAFTEHIKPPKEIDLDEWADKYRRLPRETSSEHGRWRTSRFPFLKRIMKCLSPSSKAREVVAIKGAQLGFTEVCINWIFYISDVTPGPAMYVQKTKDAAQDFSTQKLEPNIEVCPRVRNILGSGKSPKFANEVLNKGFAGGFVVLGGSNSGAFLRSKSIAYAMEDETDSFKDNVDKEGSPSALIKKRQANFPFSKMFRLSTPKFTETSVIEPAYQAGSQEQFYLPCPDCNPKAHKGGTWWVIIWDNIKFGEEKDEYGIPKEISLVCTCCGSLIPEHRKTWMLSHGRWMSEKGSPGKPYEVGDVEIPTFQISSLYSPLGFFSWRDAAAELLEYKKSGDKALLQVFINQTLGESYSAAGQTISSNWLVERREEYPAQVPAGVLVLTAGVDVQDDRLEIEIVGWGLNGENWSIDYKVLTGNPDYLGDRYGMDPMGNPTVWHLLDEYLNANYKHENGQIMRVECTIVDAGYKTEIVNKYCRFREHLRVFPGKGKEGWGNGMIRRPKTRTGESRVHSYLMFVDELKDRTYSALKVDTFGPSYCHFPKRDNYDHDHFKQLTAESKKVKWVDGKQKLYWYIGKGVRNEQLDCRNYATAALLVYAPNLQFRAEQMKAGGVAAAAIGAEGNTLHMEAEAGNNPRQKYKKPKGKKGKKKGGGGVW